MSVTEGTGHVGNTFVEVEVKQFLFEIVIFFSAAAVGMWEGRVVCELSKGVWEGRKSAFCFSLLCTPPSFPQLFTALLAE
jgi:hypothetical protein